MSDEHHAHPRVRSVERSVAALERTDDAVAFGSRMAAITSAILAHTEHGAHVVLFGLGDASTLRFVDDVLGRFGVASTRVPSTDLGALPDTFRPETRLLVSEAPTTPHNHVVDLPALAAICRERRVATLIDSTFATPFNLRPAEHGIDLVCSGGSYLAGPNDVSAGFVAGSAALVAAVRELRPVLGGTLPSTLAALVQRGMTTLAVRMSQQNRTARALAESLDGHPSVKQVGYPGLPSHPSHVVASRLMHGFGAVVSFALEGDPETTSRFLDALSIPRRGAVFGGVESVVERPARPGAPIRYAVGVEDEDVLIADVLRALAHR